MGVVTTYEVGLEQDKTDKIAAVADAGRAVASELGQDPEAVATFMAHYFRHVDPSDLEDRTVSDLLSVVESHYRAALVREPARTSSASSAAAAARTPRTASGAPRCCRS